MHAWPRACQACCQLQQTGFQQATQPALPGTTRLARGSHACMPPGSGGKPHQQPRRMLFRPLLYAVAQRQVWHQLHRLRQRLAGGRAGAVALRQPALNAWPIVPTQGAQWAGQARAVGTRLRCDALPRKSTCACHVHECAAEQPSNGSRPLSGQLAATGQHSMPTFGGHAQRLVTNKLRRLHQKRAAGCPAALTSGRWRQPLQGRA